MGELFEKVRDYEPLRCGGSECHVCGATDLPIFTYSGELLDPSLSRYPPDIEVDEVCAPCITSGKVRLRYRHSIDEFVRSWRRMGIDSTDKFIEELHRLPEVCFFQGATWPVCCDEITEYIGDAEPPREQLPKFRCWDPMDDVVGSRCVSEFYPLDDLKVMNTMAHFYCQSCDRYYWVFQYSGFLWPGPRPQT